MANIREGKVKRVRYWVDEEEQKKVDGQENKTNKDSSNMGNNDNKETSIVIGDSRAQPVKRPRTGDSPLEDLENVGSDGGGVGQKDETVPDVSMESANTRQQQDNPEDTCKEIVLELVDIASNEDGRGTGVKETDLGDREVVTGVLRQGPMGQEDPGKVPHPLVQPPDARDLSDRVPELPRVFKFAGTQEPRTGRPSGGGRRPRDPGSRQPPGVFTFTSTDIRYRQAPGPGMAGGHPRVRTDGHISRGTGSGQASQPSGGK